MKILCLALLVASTAALPARAGVTISEFLAENDSGLVDTDGDRTDWIELANDGAAAVDMAGWHLTDDAGDLNKWTFPAVTLPAGGTLVVRASGKDRRVPGTELHTNFSLTQDGEYLALVQPDAVTRATEWAPAFPPQRADISFGDGEQRVPVELVTAASAGKWRVPLSPAEGTGWTVVGYSDAAWTTGTNRVGYQTGGARPGLPIAYWTFDGTGDNVIAGGPEAVLNGAAYHASSPGPVGGGGSVNFVSSAQNFVSAELDVSETAYTASFWFRTSSATTGLFTVTDGDLGSGGFDRLLYLTGGNIAARTWNNEAIASTGKNFADGQWHHVAHVFGGSVGGQKVFVDGVQVAAGAKANSDFNWQKRINIGFTNDAGAANMYFNGQLDDVAVWSEALSAPMISSLAAGTSPLELTGISSYIGTNVQTAMQNVNASLYQRLPFAVSTSGLNRAELRVRYDDGFVAWIDGVEVARRNAPAVTPDWNAAAAGDRDVVQVITMESINLDAYVAQLTPGSHVLAVHALNDAAGSADFLLQAELSAAVSTPATNIFMDPPTPGAANGTGFAGFVADTAFSPKRGLYETAQTVTISCATPGATIAWTDNGSEPSPTNGTQVPAANAAATPSATITVGSTRILRAMAHKPASGLRPTDVDCHSYILIPNILTQPNNPAGFPTAWSGRGADYAVDANVLTTTLPGYSFRDGLASLPVMSLSGTMADFFSSAAPVGIYYDTNQRGLPGERKSCIEFISPGNLNSWAEACGTRMHGNSSRSHGFIPKHPFRLKFRAEYGASKLRRDLFGGGVQTFDEILLRGCSTDSFPVVDGDISDGEQRWNNDKATYIRDQYIRDLLIDLGHPNCRGRYVHLFLNGLYWGIYNVAERATAEWFADTFGGASEEYDVLKDFGELNDGNATAWNEMHALVNAGLSTDTQMQRLLGNNPDGTRNAAYPVYLHLSSFMDYMIVHIAAGAEDWPDHNLWVGRRRGPLSDGFRFIAWDQEISNDSLTRLSGRGSDNRFEEVDEPTCPAIIYHQLRQNPAFRRMFRQRVHELFYNGGPLSPAMQRARWALLQATIDKAIVCESARWGDANGEGIKKRETTWLNNMNWMNTPGTGYWDAVFPIDIARFRRVSLYPSFDQPSMSQEGGTVAPGYGLTFTSTQPLIYYTLDGTDPMRADGTPLPGALSYNGGVSTTNAVPPGATWKYLVTNVDQGTAWRAVSFNHTAWPEGPAQLGYGDGGEATTIGFGGNTAARYITTYFRKSFSLSSPAGIQSAKLYLLRDDGAVVYLNGTQIARSNMHATNAITWSTRALSNVGGTDESTFFYEYTVSPSLFVSGNNVLAVELHQVSETSDDLSFDARLEITSASTATPVTLTQSGYVSTRAYNSGTSEFSGLNRKYFIVNTVPASAANTVVSELHYHPLPPSTPAEQGVSTDKDDFEFIELQNISAQPVDFTGCSFTAGLAFSFPGAFHLAPGERCVVVKSPAAFTARYGPGITIAGSFAATTGLANGGELLTLTASGGGVIRSFTYDDIAPWPAAADGAGASLVLMNPQTSPDHTLASNWRASVLPGGSPGSSDALPFTGSPTADDDDDGWTNLVEYALGADPVVTHADTPGGLTFTIPRVPNADAASITGEVSTSLTGWMAADLVSASASSLTFRVPATLSGASRVFIRALVQLQ